MQSIPRSTSHLNTAFLASLHAEIEALPPKALLGNVGAKRRRAGHAVGGALDLGLDSSQTSLARQPHSIGKAGYLQLDSRALKVKKARYATLTAARLHMSERPNWVGTFIGCTYRPGCDYGPKDISNMIGFVRGWCDKNAIECRYIWVAEMQKRGVIHYHMIVFHPKKLNFPKPDKRGWWPHGSTNRSTGIFCAVAYMAKYLSKGDLAAFPKGARTYGCGGLDGSGKIEMRYWKLPTWIREQVSIDDSVKRSFGGFTNPSTGEFFPTPWEVYFAFGNVYIRRKDHENVRNHH